MTEAGIVKVWTILVLKTPVIHFSSPQFLADDNAFPGSRLWRIFFLGTTSLIRAIGFQNKIFFVKFLIFLFAEHHKLDTVIP